MLFLSKSYSFFLLKNFNSDFKFDGFFPNIFIIKSPLLEKFDFFIILNYYYVFIMPLISMALMVSLTSFSERSLLIKNIFQKLKILILIFFLSANLAISKRYFATSYYQIQIYVIQKTILQEAHILNSNTLKSSYYLN